LNIEHPIYLLAGGRGRSILSTFDIVRDILENTGKVKPVVAYIGVASLKDNWLFYIVISLLMKTRCNCRIRRVAIASPKADLNKARGILQNADAVFFSGGDVEVGMQVLKDKNMIGFIQDLAAKDKIFFGISAGSILMAKEWVRWKDPRDDSTAELFPCLGLVPIICDTHAEKDDWVELKTALKMDKPGTTGYGLTSGSCLKVYSDGRIKVESGTVDKYNNVNGQVEHLVPIEKKR
jgi:peptidase E